MDYINYFYDIYNEWYFEYYVSNSIINIQDTNEIEIIKLIKEVKNEIRLDKEIKELEDRYINLCKSIKEEDDYEDDKWDYIIHNNKTLDDLYNTLDKIVKAI